MAYLLKPVREAELAQALEAAGRINRLQLASLREPGTHRTTISSQSHRGIEPLAVDDVRCFLADQKYVTAHAPGRELLIPDTLKELEAEFGDSFVRVHRNALVALAHVQRLETLADGSWQVVLDGTEVAPAISRRHLAEVKQRIARR